MNLGTFIVAALLAVLVVLDIRYLMRKGVSQCRGDCTECGSTCKWTEDIKRAKTEIRAEKRNNLRKTV